MARSQEMPNGGSNERSPADHKLEDIPDSAGFLDNTSEPSSARDGGRGAPSLGTHSGIPKMQYRKRPMEAGGTSFESYSLYHMYSSLVSI